MNINRRWVLLALLGLLVAGWCGRGIAADAPATTAPFQVATFQAHVTPPVGKPVGLGFIPVLKTVEHPLLAKGLLLKDAGGTYALCAIDWMEVHDVSYDFLREQIAEAAGTSASRVTVHCLHQHTAPAVDASAQRLQHADDDLRRLTTQAYERETARRIAAAIREAAKHWQPVTHIGTGGLGLRLAADIFNKNQVSLSMGGSTTTFGPHPQRDTWHDLGARAVTIEGQLVIEAVAGDGSFQRLQKRRRPPDRSDMVGAKHDDESLLAHELYFGPPACEPPRLVAPGEWFRNLVLVIYCDPKRTPDRPSDAVTGRYPCLAVHLRQIDSTVAVNFAETEQTTASSSGRISVEPRSVRIVCGDP